MCLDAIRKRWGLVETLTAEHNGDRTIVRLNRPQTLNSIDQAMVDDLHEVCDQLER